MDELEGSRRRRWRFAPTLQLEQSLSLAAFVMSLTITLINAYYAMRGADITVDPPEQVLLYRDGQGSSSALVFGVRLEMINVADGYGDVLKQADVSLVNPQGSFRYQSTLKPVFAPDVKAVPDCELGLRCLALPGLYLVERSDEILDMPGGAAKAFTLSFPMVAWNCSGAPRACPKLGSFDDATGWLGKGDFVLKIRLRFHEDGDRVLTCRTQGFDPAYLRNVGWASVSCA